MNSRKALGRQFAAAGLQEEAFVRVDDCRTFARFQSLHKLELLGMRACRAMGWPYPEHCLLGCYRKPAG